MTKNKVFKPRKVPESADGKDGIDDSKAISVPFYNGSYYDPDTGTYMNASPVIEALNGAYLTRSIDRNGLMCNNVVEFGSNLNALNTSDVLSSITEKMLKALPSLPQWLAISTFAASNVLSLSVYARTALYMLRYPEIRSLMKLDGQVLLPGKYTKGVNIAAYGFVALDTILDIYTNIQKNKSAGYVIGSAVYTAATGAGIVWASGKVGAAIGSIGGPVWTIVGGIVGIVIGIGLSWLSNLLKGEIFK